MEENQDYSVTYKIILLGDSNVGKTSIINRYCKDLFQEESQPTIGVGFQPKFIDIDGQRVKLAIWDTAGQEKYRTLTKSFYRNVDGVILVYDITDPKTFENIENYWLQQLEINSNSAYQLVIVGNKVDLRDAADPTSLVPTEKAKDLARSRATLFIETSAKNNEQIQLLFIELVKRIRETTVKGNERPQSVEIQVDDQSPQDSNGICC